MPWPIALAAAGAGVLAAGLGRAALRRKRIDLRVDQHDAYLDAIRANPPAGKRPNLIIVFCDDMGYGDLSCFGARTITTPAIDALAASGARLTAFYSSSPVCSPSRAGLLTGRYPTRAHVNFVFFPSSSAIGKGLRATGLYTHGVQGLLPDEITLGEVLQAAGYVTGLVGKWHLGDRSPHLPNERGFDFFYGSHYSNDMRPYAMYRNREIDIPAPANQDELTGILTREAIQFITGNKDRPFFLHYCQPFPHHPLHASARFAGSSTAGVYGDAVQEIDWSVGEIARTLDTLGISGNTIVAFTSDNGPWHEGNPGYQRGRKNQVFEGGQRVPAVVRWPGVVEPGRVIDAPAMNIDLLPTMLEVLGIPPPRDRIIDGRNLVPLLSGREHGSPHETLHYFWGKRLLAVRSGKWKYHARHGSDNAAYHLMKPGPFLFDLEADPNESYDQAARHPAVARDLATRLEAMAGEVAANPRGWLDGGDRQGTNSPAR